MRTPPRACGSCLQQLAGARLFAVETGAICRYSEARFAPGDALLFGSETRGLPQALQACCPQSGASRFRCSSGNRSLNLANAVAVVVYEAGGRTASRRRRTS